MTAPHEAELGKLQNLVPILAANRLPVSPKRSRLRRPPRTLRAGPSGPDAHVEPAALPVARVPRHPIDRNRRLLRRHLRQHFSDGPPRDPETLQHLPGQLQLPLQLGNLGFQLPHPKPGGCSRASNSSNSEPLVTGRDRCHLVAISVTDAQFGGLPSC